MSKPIIEVQNVSKKYKIGTKQPYYSIRDSIAGLFKKPSSEEKNFWALKDIFFKVNQGEVLGIIGRNGAGKSTLLKILSQITPPTAGKIILRGRVASLLEVGTGFHPELTGRENIYLNGSILGMKRQEIKKKFDEIVDFSEIEEFLDTPVKHYSSGMYTRLAFAVAAHLEPEILIVDEVLAVGDVKFQSKCLGKMSSISKEGRTILFVSHNLNAIQNLCPRSILLDRGKIVKAGPTDEVINQYVGKIKCNEVKFDDILVKKAQIYQKGEELLLEVAYDGTQQLDIPCFGFVISNNLGVPIFGANPLTNPPKDPIPVNRKGQIKVKIKYPQLLDGTYRLSIWMGDGKSEFFSSKDCLTFEVVNMKKGKQLSASAAGSVSPSCDWLFI